MSSLDSGGFPMFDDDKIIFAVTNKVYLKTNCGTICPEHELADVNDYITCFCYFHTHAHVNMFVRVVLDGLSIW